MQYIKLVIAIDDEYQENLIAELLDLDFDSFEQKEGKIISYVPKQKFNDVYRERIEQLLVAYRGNGFIETEEVVADQNWNEQWENTIKAQRIGSFFVKPTWVKKKTPDNAILLEIDPKMAFGTGYHESTRLLLNILPEVINEEDLVLDAGTGTGILAIACVKLGARQVFGFDIDEWSIRNATENIYLNEVENQITIKKGSAEVIKTDRKYDVALANIERNTILELLPDLTRALRVGGSLMLSGLLHSDKQSITKKLNNCGFTVRKVISENEWIAIWATKKT